MQNIYVFVATYSPNIHGQLSEGKVTNPMAVLAHHEKQAREKALELVGELKGLNVEITFLHQPRG